MNGQLMQIKTNRIKLDIDLARIPVKKEFENSPLHFLPVAVLTNSKINPSFPSVIRRIRKKRGNSRRDNIYLPHLTVAPYLRRIGYFPCKFPGNVSSRFTQVFEPLGSFHLFQVTNRFSDCSGWVRTWTKAVKLNATREKGCGKTLKWR